MSNPKPTKSAQIVTPDELHATALLLGWTIEYSTITYTPYYFLPKAKLSLVEHGVDKNKYFIHTTEKEHPIFGVTNTAILTHGTLKRIMEYVHDDTGTAHSSDAF